MLVAMIAVYLTSGDPGSRTFDIPTLIALASTEGHALNDLNFQIWVFLGFFIGFAVKVPIFPFHTWLPDAHVEASDSNKCYSCWCSTQDGYIRSRPDKYGNVPVRFGSIYEWFGFLGL